METCFNYTDKEKCWVSSDERKWIHRIQELAKEKPDEVRIIKQPEENDGCIYATLPPDWIKIHPKRVLSDEKRAEMSERARNNFHI